MKTMLATKPRWVLLMLAFCCFGLQSYADTEPNDNLATAENAAFGATVSGSLNQSPVGDFSDQFLIVAPSDGDITLSVDVATGLSVYINLYDKTGGGEVYKLVVGGNSDNITKYCMAQDTFLVVINRQAGAGTYSFTTSLNGSGFENDTEFNGNIGSTTQFITEGQTVEGHIGYYDTDLGYDEYDYFGVILPEDGSYTFRAIKDPGKTSEQFYFAVLNKLDGEYSYVLANSDTTLLTINCLAADTVYMRTDRYTGCGGYTLSFENTTPPGTPNDIEPNGNLASTSQFITSGESVTGHIGYIDTDLPTYYDEYDYFGVILPEDGSYTFRAIKDPGKTSEQFYFAVLNKLDGEYSYVLATGDTTLLTINCLAADTVYMRTDRYSGCGGYTLSFENTTPPGTPNDIEPNGNLASTSQFITTGESVTGHIGYIDTDLPTYYDEYDYFGVILPEDGSYTFRAIKDPGKTSEQFYFAVLNKLDGEYSYVLANSDTTLLTINCLAADTVYMRTDRYSGCGGYTLSFENTTPPGTANDIEPNGNLASTSQFITTGESVTGHIGYIDTDLPTGYDEYDYFGVILPEDGSYTFRAIKDPGHGQMNFYLTLRDKNDAEFTHVYSNNDTTDVTVNCLAADTVYLVVDRYNGCGGYTLSFDAPELTYDNDTSYNETLEAAALVPTSSVNEGHLGYKDADTGVDKWDYYKFAVVQVPFDLDIKVEIAEGLNTYLDLLNPAGVQIQSEYHTPGSYNYTRTLTVAGDYYFRLHHSSGCGSYSIGNFCANAPEVEISANGPTDICPGESVTLTATSGLNAYAWFKDGVEVGTEQTYVASGPGTYFAAGYDINGCDGISDEIVIGVFGVPNVSISTEDETTFCEGGSITLTATAGFDSYAWSNGDSGQSIEVTESGTYTVTATTSDGCDAVSSNSIDVTVQVDSDGDGICDVDDSCPDLFGQVGDPCDDGNPNTDNDVITADCECVGTPIITYDCPELEANIGDACDDGDASTENDMVTEDCGCAGTPIITYDCPELEANIGDACTDPDGNAGVIDGDCNCFVQPVYDCPELEANIGDACDDGNPNTENDMVTADCGCEGTPIITYDCPELEANIGDACDDGDPNTENDVVTEDCGCEGTPIITYDCPDLEANIGDSCDDGDPNTENDMVTADCGCEGTPIITYDCPDLEANIGDSCDDGDELTENDMITADCGCAGTPVEIFDCPDLEENIGDSCDDGNPNTENDVVTEDCGCEGTPIEPGDCVDFVYYLADFTAGMGTDIYKVELSGGDANLTFIANTADEVHIAYNSGDNLIYAVSKLKNEYTTLNPNIASPAFSAPVSLGGAYGQITGAAFFDDTKLLISSQNMDEIYSVNLLNSNVSVFDSNAPVFGGDIALRSDGMLYMATNAFGGGLYEVYPEGVLPDMYLADLSTGNTGLAITNSDQLLLSQKENTSLSLLNSDGSDAGSYDLIFNGEAFTLNYGDLASGCNSYSPPNPGECEDFSTFFAQFDASLNQTDIYSVIFSGSDAILTAVTSVSFEAHIGYDAMADVLYLVSKTGSFIRPYSPGGDSYMPDVALDVNLYSVTSAVFDPLDGMLYIGDANTNKVYSVDPSTGAATLYGSAPVYGGDLGLLEDGTLYLASQSGNALYDLSDSNNPVLVGSIPSKVTGIACSNTSMGFVISNYQSDVFTEVSAMDGSIIAAYTAVLNGESFTLMYGDMAAGCADGSDGGVATKGGQPNATTTTTGNNGFTPAVLPSGTLTSSPNPTSGDSKVVFSVPSSSRTLVEVYDMNGRKVATLFNEVADANREYTLDFDGNYLPNGVYIYRMTTDNETIIEKFMIAK